jgi:hypothetical protein
LGEVNASINFVTGEYCGSDEDEEWWVNIVRVEEEQGARKSPKTWGWSRTRKGARKRQMITASASA